MKDIRIKSAKMLKENFGIEETITGFLFEKGIIREDIMRKVLLREEYRQKVGPNGKQLLKNQLAQKYCVSIRVVERSVQ